MGENVISVNKSLSSQTLFQFTNSLSTIIKIVESRSFWPRYTTQYSWGGYNFAIPVSCFCDIPLSQVMEHVKYYGGYGLGMRKKWATDNGLTPVWYIQPNSSFSNRIKYGLRKMANSENINDFEEFCLLLFLVKKTIGDDYKIVKIKEPSTSKSNNQFEFEKRTRRFYDEKEWRYVPEIPSYTNFLELSREKFSKESLDVFNSQTLKYSLRFDYDDISYIIVESEARRKELVKYLVNNSSKLCIKEEHLLILISKILSIEQIANDF